MPPCCAGKRWPPIVLPKVSGYPCREEEPDLEVAVCREVGFGQLESERQKQRERREGTKRSPCSPGKPPSKKRFLQLEKSVCGVVRTRKWDVEEPPCGDSNEPFPKWFKRRGVPPEDYCLECPRELDDYERKLWMPICKKPKKETPVETEPVDPNLCVFCLGCLYTGGFLHELHEKLPLILEQSKIYGDEVAARVGIRTRVVVHKKCYDAYVDVLAHKEEVEAVPTEESTEEDSDFCGEGREESEEEVVGDIPPRKPYFCLRKPEPPPLDPGEMGKFKPHGLVADLWPNVRLLQLSGHFLHEYHEDNSAMSVMLRKVYSCTHLVLIFAHFASIIANLAMEADDVNILAANSITVLFFTHCITKFCYFALRRQKFYRTLAIWDTQNSHPLFAESHARHRAMAIAKSRRLLMITVVGTLLTVVGWTGSTFFGESTKTVPDPDNKNETITMEIPRLMLRAWYPWDATTGSNYMFSFVYQLYWLVFTLFHANLMDLLLCSWLIFACEQLLHVKEIMKPLIDLSSSLDTYNPGSADLFKAAGAIDDNVENFFESKEERQINIRSIYSNMRDFGINRSSMTGPIGTVNGIGPNGLSKKHEMLVRSAIKYWVERHKHIVRYVGAIGDAYGLALLLHMLTSTITLTLLAYQATKIDGMDLYAMAVLGYLFYSLAQVFAFCIYGNQLIEESSSVMEAAYSCQWYDGSEEAKTFVQIVCQQCQKALSVSGAKFFTVSLDLFASVLGAVVTYFMVLVQLK